MWAYLSMWALFPLIASHRLGNTGPPTMSIRRNSARYASISTSLGNKPLFFFRIHRFNLARVRPIYAPRPRGWVRGIYPPGRNLGAFALLRKFPTWFVAKPSSFAISPARWFDRCGAAHPNSPSQPTRLYARHPSATTRDSGRSPDERMLRASSAAHLGCPPSASAGGGSSRM